MFKNDVILGSPAPVRFPDTFVEGACFKVRQNKGVPLEGFILSTLNEPLKIFLH